jgi:DNA-binding NarL/FixJ family response regulator
LLLVDDHDIVRWVCDPSDHRRLASSPKPATNQAQRALETQPAIVLMDINMPRMDGLEATRQLKQSCPNTQVLALTVHDDKQYFMQMLAAGASGYLTKLAAPDELVAAIRSVADGNIYLQPALARWLIEDYQRLSDASTMADLPAETRSPEATGLDVLSPRERQVLELVARGQSNVEIGRQLGLSPKTIARHRERIMKRLSMHSRTELVKFALRTGLISLE